MSALTRLATIPSVARLIAHVRTPLYRNGYALVFSSVATSGLGVLYWILAARYYPAETIGLNSAVISAMMFLANLSQLNLVNALNRFVPCAGRATARLVVSAYLISVVLALLSSLGFVMGLNVWAPTLGFLGSGALFTAWFSISTMAWCVFVLQDSVLTGLREATWVPVENIIFAAIKLVLLVAFAEVFPSYGVLASWTLSMIIVLLPTNLLLFRWLIPRHARSTAERVERVRPAQIARYVAGDYLSALIWTSAVNLLPILVIERAGAVASAHFYLSWTIAYALELVSRNMGMSLIAEAATDQAKLPTYSYRTFIHTARLLVPTVMAMVVGAPYILHLFGAGYASEGTALLRLLCLSVLPNMAISLSLSVARVRRQMTLLIAVLTSLCILVLALSYILLGLYGITGVGMAWLLSQSLVAAVLLLTQLRALWLSQLDLRLVLRLLVLPRQWWRDWSQRRHAARAHQLIPAIAPSLPRSLGTMPPAAWSARRFVRTMNDITVMALGAEGHPPAAILKLPQTDRARASLQRQTQVLTDLQADSRLGEWRRVVPTPLAQGDVAGQAYVVEQMLPGVPAGSLLSNAALRPTVLAAAAAAIGELHQRTSALTTVDAHLLHRWVDEPVATLRSLNGAYRRGAHDALALERLASQLYTALADRQVCVSWIHGDYTPENILLTPDGRTVTGLVDWDQAAPDGLPQLDFVQLFLAVQQQVQGRELGDVVRERLGDAHWAPYEQALLERSSPALSAHAIEPRALVLLGWLRHVTANLNKSIRYSRHWFWLSRNVESVLQSL